MARVSPAEQVDPDLRLVDQLDARHSDCGGRHTEPAFLISGEGVKPSEEFGGPIGMEPICPHRPENDLAEP
jgi:hypothetical protein